MTNPRNLSLSSSEGSLVQKGRLVAIYPPGIQDPCSNEHKLLAYQSSLFSFKLSCIRINFIRMGCPHLHVYCFEFSRQETSSDGSGCFLLAHPPPSADWPQNSMEYNRRRTFDHFKVTNIVKVHEANFPAVGSDSDQADAAWPTGVVWLMVRCQSMLVLSVYSFDIDITHHNCIICQSFPNSGTT